MDFAAILSLSISLIIDIIASWIRMFTALGVSIVISIAVGIYAATSKRAERIILPVVDVLQTLPILAFFPFVVYIVVATLPGYIGINAAVIFLIVTSMIWNIIFGVYETVKVLPREILEIADLYGLGFRQRLSKIYIPASMPRVVEQSILSWSIGLFYLVTSEIFSTGNSNYSVVHGIGVALTALAASGNASAYLLGIVIFIAFVVATRLLFFKPLEEYVSRYNRPVAVADKEKVTITRMMATKVLSRLKYENLGRMGLILKARRRRRRGIERGGFEVGRISPVYWYAIVAAIVLVLGWLAATNLYLIGYEYTVLVAFVYSFARVWLAFLVSLLIGIPVCVYLIFISRHTSKYILLFQILASIPATILLPAIAAALSGHSYSGELVAFVVFVLSGIWYIIFSTMNMAKTLPSNIIEVKEVFGVRGISAWKSVYMRAIIPGLITGSLTAIAAEWNASIVAEYFGAVGSQVGVGIGKLLDLSLSGNNLVLMAVALLNLVVMILLINTFVWKRLYKKVSETYR